MKNAAVALVCIAALACVQTPSAQRMAVIEPGVVVAGVRVGGLASEPARARLASAFDRPLVVFHGRDRIPVRPSRLGAGAAIDDAVSQALRAAPGRKVPLRVDYAPPQVASFVSWLARRFDREPVDARFLHMGAERPVIAEAKPGTAVRQHAMERLLGRALQVGVREPLPVLVRPVPAKVTRESFGPIVVIARGSNTLTLWDSTRLVRSFRVATGRSQYPTPFGQYSIVTMQQNPWWLPPQSDWARGLKPVPPGPGNPLGTRWMGLSAPGVGIHGTPDAASIGYSASHGCIRMQIPDAEWLFGHVRVGTPVQIL